MSRSWSEALRADEGEPLTTPFEDWCTSQGIHPEKFGAWESYQAISTAREGAGVTA
ncbi:hypothetical protein ACT8ZV_22340 [Nocardioides sp. MAHUQ-72]|uniref:hypothetical protein n=1 Tax=unclassified Nocardioides TaxID=2615069 RepID=UPI0036066ECD